MPNSNTNDFNLNDDQIERLAEAIVETFNTKEEIHPDSAYGQWMKRFNPEK